MTETILAVDDDRTILGLIEVILLEAGYHVLTADSGWSAVRLFESEADRVDLLVTDVVMPDLTGPVLASRLRKARPDLKVMFISGFHDTELVHRFVTEQGFALVPKPFSRDGLLRAVRELLQAAA